MTLRIDNRIIETVEEATLSLIIETEDRAPVTRVLNGKQTSAKQYGPDYSTAYWNLKLIIDLENDDECAPNFWTPVDGATFPAQLSQLSGTRLIVTDQTEATYGTHGPALDETVLELGDWLSPEAVLVRWTAEYEDWYSKPTQRLPFSFEGAVIFSGIEMRVKREEDATPILSHVLPMLDQSAFVMSLGRQIELGPLVQAEPTTLARSLLAT